MAPVTPSPHRFITSKQRSASPTKKAQPPSHKIVTSETSRSSHSDGFEGAGQFASTPRFAAGRKPARSSRPRSPPRSSFANALRATGHLRDDVEESALQTTNDEEMLDGEQANALPTTESSDQHNEFRALPFSPKRRRLDDLNPNDLESTPARYHLEPTFAKPQTPASAHRLNIPRFSTTAGAAPDGRDEISSQARSAFLRPSLAPTEASEPLPEAFSPHHRGQKFVPGGVAATVQQWVVEAGQAATQGRRGRGYLRGDDFELKFTVLDCKGNGPFMIMARTIEGDDARLLLTCGASPAQRTSTVQIGAMVGMRAPTWDIVVEEITWKVGIDWRVL
ncbi:hypothetical protein LTR78_001416 [Recurvomyces mirabilis]|uniref:Uncharacterized protein n=1 Tax=Recurvomyces mirabilis TaxID=574656 RepID=A0AAE0WW07_9PEZI|nr:hypothetical protein LTR78_001416 [Recurvomyces mirabilis]KAK5161394.1 hypothetical protein LTS14_001190 [Recurvomyces mirabilis]